MSDTGFVDSPVPAPPPQNYRRKCKRPPIGWYCNGHEGHDGPCAAWPKWWAHPIWWLRCHE